MKDTCDKQKPSTVIERLLETLVETPASKLGTYDDGAQTWSHREAGIMSPVKNNRES